MIKKAFGILFLLLFLLLAACSTGVENRDQEILPELQQKFSFGFTASVEMTYATLTAEAEIVRTPAACDIRYSAPETLDGLSCIFSEGQITLSYKGIEEILAPHSLPHGAAAQILHSATGSSLQNATTVMGDELITVRGVTEAGPFVLEINRETGLPAKLSVEEQQLEIVFTDFAFSE